MSLKRNEACVCGSGKKYKKCCYNENRADNGKLISPSAVKSQIESYMQLAQGYYNAGDILNAAHLGKEVLKINPKHPEALFLCGVIMCESGQFTSAANLLSSAITQKPKESKYYKCLTIVYNKLCRFGLAQSSIEEAIKLSPNECILYNILGSTLCLRGNYLEAKYAFCKAIDLNPKELHYYLNLGVCLYSAGFSAEFQDLYQKILLIKSDTIVRIPFLAMAVPTMADNYKEIIDRRKWVNKEIDVLLNTALKDYNTNNLEATRNTLKNPLFNLAYHGFNDKDLVSKFNVLYKKHLPYFNYVAPHVNGIHKVSKNKKPRVGFISHYFWNHSVGKCFNKFISKLCEVGDLEITVFTEKRVNDQYLQNLANSQLNYIELPFNYDYAKKIIAEAELDILIYTDIGMNDETYALAMGRFAKIQCCLAGHPVTTGLSTIDYYISSRNFESNNAQEHYSETLLLLNNVPALIERPIKPVTIPDRKELKLPETGNLYICPMTLYKIHPEFDEIMANILRADPSGFIILFEDVKVRSYMETLKRRFQRVISDVEERIIFYPWVSSEEFYQLLMTADVILDPIHFGGGTTTYFVMGLGIPMVTLPFESFRSSVTASCYKLMNIPEMIAQNSKNYVEIAVKVANDLELRQTIKDKIIKSNNILFDNEKELVGEMKQLIQDLISDNITPYLAKQ